MNNRIAWMGLRVAGATLALVPVASAAQWGAPELVGSGSPSRLILSPDGAHRAVTEDNAALDGPPARRVGGIWERTVLPANAQFGSRINARGDVLALGRSGSTTDDVSATLIAAGGATSSQTLAPRPDTKNGLFANPRLADLNAAGDCVVAWLAGGAMRVAYRSMSTGTWDSIATIPTVGARTAAIAIAPGGAATLVWVETTAAGDVLKASFLSGGGASWTPPTEIRALAPAPIQRLGLGVDGAGAAMVVWHERGEIRSASRTPVSGSWDVEPSVGRGTDPSLAVNATGHAVVAWTAPTGIDGSSRGIHARRRPPGGGWGPMEVVSATNIEGFTPNAAIADDGSAIVSWWRNLRPYTGAIAPIPQAAVAPAGEGWGAPSDLAAPQNVEFNYSQTVAIRDAQHAGAVWATSDGGGAGTVASFAEYSPTATPATPARASIRGLGTASSRIPAHSVAMLQIDAGRPVERLPPAVLEQRVGTRWVVIRPLRLGGLFPNDVRVRVGAPGQYRFRVRLIGRSPAPPSVTVTAVRSRRRIVTPCLKPVQAVAGGGVASVLCEGEDLTVFMRRVDLRTGRTFGSDATVGSGAYGDFGPFGNAVVDDGKTIWVLRDTTLLPIDRRTGRRYPPVAIDEEGLGKNLIASGNDGLAVMNATGDTLIRVNTATRRVVARVALPPDDQADQRDIAIGPSGVWISRRVFDDGSWYFLHITNTNTVARIPGKGPLSTGPLGVWELGPRGLRRVDPPSSRPVVDISRLKLDGLAVGTDALWGWRRRPGRAGALPQIVATRLSPVTTRPSGPPAVVGEQATLLPVPGGLWALLAGGLVRVR